MARAGSSGGGAMPQDLEFIMQMVHGETTPAVQQPPAELDAAAGLELKETETDSEASSDSEDEDSEAGSSDDESDDDSADANGAATQAGTSAAAKSSSKSDAPIEIKGSEGQPMTAEKHASLLAQLSSFMGTDDAELNADGEGYITADSEEEGELEDEDDESEEESEDDRPDPAEIIAMEDDDDEPAPSGPLVTANEVAEEPVRAPPIRKLPEGIPVVFAGEVVHYVPDPAALKALQQQAEAQRTEAESAQQSGQAEKGADDAEDGEVQEGPVAVPATAEKGVDAEDEIMHDFVDTPPPVSANAHEDSTGAAVEAPATVKSTDAANAVVDEDVVDMVAASAASPEDEADKTSSPANATVPDVTAAAAEAGAPSSAAPAIGAAAAIPTSSPARPDTKGKGKAKEPKITSSGKVVIRAMRPPEGVFIGERRVGDDEGWLEEGSLVCFKDGRVIATVAETFGPLTSPFYLLRLPPPPFPMPTADELTPGTAVYYPSTQNRSYVPVKLLRTDKRYKGSDASNRYDEEVGDDEREWSDDEEEAMAKRGEKLRRQGRADGSVQGDRAGPSRSRHYDDAGGGGGGALDYGGEAMSVDSTGSYGQGGRGRGAPRGGDRGRGARGGRGGRGGPPGARFDDQAFGGRGRGRGGPAQRGGFRPPSLPVAKPSEATINMAETIGRRDVPQGRPDGAPVAPLPARPPVPIPAAAPQQQAYAPQMQGYPAQGGQPGGYSPQQPWNPQQMGYGMPPNMMPQQGFYGGMPGFGGPQAGFPQMYGAMHGGQGMPYMPQAYGYPGFAPQGAAINPRFMAQAQAQAQGMGYAPQAQGGQQGPTQQQQQQPGYPGQQGQ